MLNRTAVSATLFAAVCLTSPQGASAKSTSEVSKSVLSMRTPIARTKGLLGRLFHMQAADPSTPDPVVTPDPAAAPAAPEAPAAPAPAEAAPAEAAGPDAQVMTEEEMLAQALAEAEAAEEAGGDDGTAEAQGEVIEVTGSLVERSETTTPAPVSVVTKKTLEESGKMTLGDILQDLPAQSNGINTNFNNGGDGSARINLRGLGSNRTLVLLNGRRHVAGGTGANSSVDLNAIPLAVIERVEVLKDGASAVYGSDAIGGVVNIITRRDYSGVEASLYTGSSQRGDGEVYDVSFVTGQKSKKGNVIFSAGYSEQRPIFAGDRAFSKVDKDYNFTTGEVTNGGSTATPEGYIGDPTGGVCPSGRCARNPETGQWENFNFAGNTGDGSGSLYNYQPVNYLVTPLTRYNIFALGDYKLHSNVRAFFEASYMNRKSDQQLAPEPLFTLSEGLPLSGDSVYNTFGRDLFDVRRRMVEAGPRGFSQDVNTFRIVTGLDGDIPVDALDGWKWETSFNYGLTRAITVKEGLLQRSHVANAIGPSYLDESGVAQCGTPDNPGPAGCVPLNLLGGEGTITDEMLKYLTYTGTGNGSNEQQIWQVKAGGPIATTPWDGNVSLALGASYRREEGGFQPDPLTAIGDTTGNKGEATHGSYNVKDAFAELSVVPVTGHPLAQWLEFNAAARGVDYNTFGNEVTWKAGALWKTKIGLALRGTYGTAFRAPNVGELFAGESDSFPSATDPCNTRDADGNVKTLDPVVAANCAADNVPADFSDQRTQLKSRVGGNPDLQPETSNVFTTGLVFEPTSFAEGLALTLDYFRYEVNDAIQATGANVILSNCYSQTDRSDCDKIIRLPADAPAGARQISQINDLGDNIGGNDTDGIDFGAAYTYNIPAVGRLRHSFEGTWLHKYTNRFPGRDVEGVGVYDLGVFPRWRFNVGTQWGKDGFGVGANARYIHHFRECEEDDCGGTGADRSPNRKVSINVTADLFANYSFKSPAGDSNISIGVNNITDRDPSRIYQGFLANSDASTYDYLGRYAYLRFTQSY